MGLDVLSLCTVYCEHSKPVYWPSSLCGLSGQTDDHLPVLGVESGHVPRVLHHLLRHETWSVTPDSVTPLTWSYIQGT